MRIAPTDTTAAKSIMTVRESLLASESWPFTAMSDDNMTSFHFERADDMATENWGTKVTDLQGRSAVVMGHGIGATARLLSLYMADDLDGLTFVVVDIEGSAV